MESIGISENSLERGDETKRRGSQDLTMEINLDWDILERKKFQKLKSAQKPLSVSMWD